MKLRILLRAKFRIAAVMRGGSCPAESFITDGEAAYGAARSGLADLLDYVSQNGLSGLSSKLTHEVDKQRKIFEFCKGDLRLFYFKGQGGVIVICTSGLIKKGRRADKCAVAEAARYREDYLAAVRDGSLEWVDEGE